MQKAEVKEQLRNYIAKQVLDGKEIDLNDSTLLLEWGIINSIEIARLLGFIEQQFNVKVPPDRLLADNFVTIPAIADLVESCAQAEQLKY